MNVPIELSSLPTTIELTVKHEEALLGAIIADPSVIVHVGSNVTDADFLDRGVGRAVQFIADMHHSGKAVGNVSVVAASLQAAGILRQLGLERLRRIASEAMPYHVRFWAQEVRRASILRRLQHTLEAAASACREPQQDPNSLVERVNAALRAANVHDDGSLVSMSQVASDAILEILEARQRQGTIGVPTQLMSLDESTGGLFPGEMTLLAARPSVGKSALATEIAFRAAWTGRKVLFVSLEMHSIQIAYRLFNRLTGIPIRRMQNATLSDQDMDAIRECQDTVKRLDIQNVITTNATVSTVHAYAKMMDVIRGCDLIIIDYLGLLRSSSKGSSYERVTEISREIKCMAIDLNKPVLALCQLNRMNAKEMPTLENLRDSGALEQDADNVWLLHRESRDAQEAQLIIAKQRQGSVGTIQLDFFGDRMEFNGAGEPRFLERCMPAASGMYEEFGAYAGLHDGPF